MIVATFCLILLTSGFAFSVAVKKPIYDIEQAESYFEEFITKYGNQYTATEKVKRLAIFKENLKRINELNSDPDETAVFGINQFTDLTKEEHSRYRGFNPTLSLGDINCAVKKDKDVVTNDAPATFDWRTQNVVTEVKDQGQCGYCWAFGTIGNIEGQNAIKNGKLLSLSEQQLVDCCTNNSGCNGGSMPQAMSDLIGSGVELETDYPYIADQHPNCQFKQEKAAVNVTGCTVFDLTDENKVKELLYKTGPLTIGINGEPLQIYDGGILKNCTSGDVDHAVLLVGYGTENGLDYWLIKNSWTDTWGEKGYGRFLRGVNACSLMNKFMCSTTVA